jgi:hypothetical protein
MQISSNIDRPVHYSSDKFCPSNKNRRHLSSELQVFTSFRGGVTWMALADVGNRVETLKRVQRPQLEKINVGK